MKTLCGCHRRRLALQSGYIGVETREADRHPRTAASDERRWQATHAVRDAQSVDGVREVRNILRAKVGGAT